MMISTSQAYLDLLGRPCKKLHVKRREDGVFIDAPTPILIN